MIIDTHAHLNFKVFNKDREKVIQRTLENKVWVINASSNFETSKKAVEIARQGIFAAVGLHPMDVEQGFDYEKYKELAKNKWVVAVGETGLDYWKKPSAEETFKQKDILLKHLQLARELSLPVLFHCRKAHNDLLSILKGKEKGVIHCFTGNLRQAQKYLSLGYYLGFNGIIFKLSLDDVIKKIPLERMLIETDCPYLTPPPLSGRNEPLNVRYVAQRIAQVRGEKLEKIVEQTTENARDLFGI